jgi:hypothetical protein
MAPALEGEQMPKSTREPRETAEARFDRIQKTVTNLTETDRTAVRGKIAQLKALRTAKEEAEREASQATSGSPSRRKSR